MRKTIYFILFFNCLLLSNASLTQEVFVINESHNLQYIGEYVYFLEDSLNELTIKDIQKPENQAKFQKNNRIIFSRPATQSTYWFKIQVQNKSKEEVWLDITRKTSWYIDVFSPNEDGSYDKSLELGSLRPIENLPFKSSGFWFPIKSSPDIEIYYIKVQTLAPMVVPFRVGSLSQLFEQQRKEDYITAGFVGLMLIMFLYNSFLYISTRNKLYLLYLGYLFFVTLYTSFLNNARIVYAFDLGLFLDTWWDQNLTIWSAPLSFFSGLFCIFYLKLKQRLPWVTYILYFDVLLISFIFPILHFIEVPEPTYLPAFMLCSFLLYLICLLSAYYLLIFKKVKEARFYALGWSFFFISLFVYLGSINGFASYNFYSVNAMYFGVALEVWMFSLALGDNINTLRKENLRLIREQNETLETKITERTQELKESNEELLVMNEELRQTQEELQTQRDFLDVKNKQLDDFNKKIKGSIQAAESIQNVILPYEGKFERLFTEHFIINKPKDVVSGDFYWLKEYKEKIILVVADCTGHGVPGAFMTLIGTNLLDKIVDLEGIHHPDLILEALHKEIQYFLKQKHTRNNNGMDAVVVTFQNKEEQILMNFSGAKNNILICAKEELIELRGTRKSIGGVQNENIHFENYELVLKKDSIIYLGSDGLEDQNDSKRKKFGRKRLKKIITEIESLPLPEQKNKIEESLERYMENTDQRDDILWMGIKI